MSLLFSFITDYWNETEPVADPISKRQKHLVCEQIRLKNVPRLKAVAKPNSMKAKLAKMKRVPSRWRKTCR